MIKQRTRSVVSRGFPSACLALLALSCSGDRPDIDQMPAFGEQGIHVVVEIPAGTNLKIEYDPATGSFLPDREGESERSITFLPYPGNYGFIPSTLVDASDGGDGDPLDVLLLSSALPTGSVVEAMPVAALLLLDDGERDTKIIAVPLDSTRRVIDVDDFRSLLMEYDAARRIIEEWFLNYKGLGATELVGWKDEQFAAEEVRRRQIH